MSQKYEEIVLCAECDSEEPLRNTCVNFEQCEYLTICPDCRSVEGSTKTMFRNRKTDELLTEAQYTTLPDEEA